MHIPIHRFLLVTKAASQITCSVSASQSAQQMCIRESPSAWTVNTCVNVEQCMAIALGMCVLANFGSFHLCGGWMWMNWRCLKFSSFWPPKTEYHLIMAQADSVRHTISIALRILGYSLWTVLSIHVRAVLCMCGCVSVCLSHSSSTQNCSRIMRWTQLRISTNKGNENKKTNTIHTAHRHTPAFRIEWHMRVRVSEMWINRGTDCETMKNKNWISNDRVISEMISSHWRHTHTQN